MFTSTIKTFSLKLCGLTVLKPKKKQDLKLSVIILSIFVFDANGFLYRDSEGDSRD